MTQGQLTNRTKEDILQDLATSKITVEAATKELASIEEKVNSTLHCKVSQKGAVSVYGLQRMPVTLYAGQWERLLDFAAEIQTFIKARNGELSRKPAKEEKKAA